MYLFEADRSELEVDEDWYEQLTGVSGSAGV